MVALALVGVLSVAGSATAAPTRGVSEDAISSPRGMVLSGTHGYRVVVDAYPAGRRRGARVFIAADGVRSLIRYAAPANLAGEGIRASLGRFGRIDMRWVPDGRVSVVKFGCHGHGPRRESTFDRGAYVGTLRFRGGSGFTAVRAHRVEWQPSWYRDDTTCRRGGRYRPGRGRILEAVPARHVPGVRFLANQPKLGAPVEYEAADRETVGRVEVERATWAYGGPRSLITSPDFSSTTAEPPAPFAGTATFERTKGARGTWTGDLRVHYADGSVAPLAGRPFVAAFVRGSLEGGVR
jgi:hypothetical protein